jgi:EAL domain-containing protein (putative c-di-GMP-specific phosphodiesterase class I)
LHHAITNKEFELYYQPIYDIHGKNFQKAEALLRWKNKKLGSVSPAEFIPIAEDIGFITSIGRWVIESAIEQQSKWKNTILKNLVISLNVSPKQLADKDFVKHVNHTIEAYNLDSTNLIFEITESLFLLDESIFERLDDLNNLGIRIAIDDFGTGYSNLNYLNKLHVASLKIDKTFIDQIDKNKFNDSVLLAIIAIGKRMQFKITAEGVETESQLAFLEKNECDEIQGDYFSKPLPSVDFERFIKSHS